MAQNVNMALWISRYQCWRCNQQVKVLVGVFIDDKAFSIADLPPKIYKTIETIFKDEIREVNLKIINGAFGEIYNYCNYCNAKIGNFYVFDDIFVEQMPFDFEDVKKNYKKVPYDEVKMILESPYPYL